MTTRIGTRTGVGPKYCPKCYHRAQCTNSRDSNEFCRRRYSCMCGHRWTTMEMILHDDQTGRGSSIKRHMAGLMRDDSTIERVTEALQRLIAEIRA